MTGPRLRYVPDQPKTPQRSIRVPDELWDEVGRLAERQGRHRSDVIRELLERWVRREQAKQ